MKTGIILGLFIWGVIAAGTFILSAFADYDDTDDQTNRTRSGLKLYKDHGTGCEYLSSGHFHLTPRTGMNGTQAGCRSN